MGKIIERVRQRSAKRQCMIAENELRNRLVAEQMRAQNQASPGWWAAVNQQNAMSGCAYGIVGARLQNSEEAKLLNETAPSQLANVEASAKPRKWWQFW